MKGIQKFAVGVTFALCCAIPTSAQTDSSERILDAFKQCRAIPASAQKLVCFEANTDKFEAEVKSKTVTIVDRQDIQKAKRSLFGFTLPKIDLFGGRDNDEAKDPVEIDTLVASTYALPNGHAEIKLADDTGALWQTADPMPFPPRVGAKIHIRQGALGNYFMSIEGRSYRGTRVR